MKKTLIATAYCGLLGFTILLNSCQDDPIVPNSPNDPIVDTTWCGTTWCDSTLYDSNGEDTLTDPTGGGNPSDSTGG